MLSGDLGIKNITSSIKSIAQQKRSGIMLLKKGEEKGKIIFHKGTILAGEIENMTDLEYLRRFLIFTNRLAPSQFSQIKNSLFLTDQSIEDLLIQKNILTRSKLDEVLLNKLRYNLYEMVTWKNGKFVFTDANMEVKDEVSGLPESIAELIEECYRRNSEWEQYKKDFPPLESIIYRNTEQPVDVGKDSFQEVLLHLVDNKHNIKQIYELLYPYRFNTLYLIMRLLHQRIAWIEGVSPKTSRSRTRDTLILEKPVVAQKEVETNLALCINLALAQLITLNPGHPKAEKQVAKGYEILNSKFVGSDSVVLKLDNRDPNCMNLILAPMLSKFNAQSVKFKKEITQREFSHFLALCAHQADKIRAERENFHDWMRHEEIYNIEVTLGKSVVHEVDKEQYLNLQRITTLPEFRRLLCSLAELLEMLKNRPEELIATMNEIFSLRMKAKSSTAENPVFIMLDIFDAVERIYLTAEQYSPRLVNEKRLQRLFSSLDDDLAIEIINNITERNGVNDIIKRYIETLSILQLRKLIIAKQHSLTLKSQELDEDSKWIFEQLRHFIEQIISDTSLLPKILPEIQGDLSRLNQMRLTADIVQEADYRSPILKKLERLNNYELISEETIPLVKDNLAKAISGNDGLIALMILSYYFPLVESPSLGAKTRSVEVVLHGMDLLSGSKLDDIWSYCVAQLKVQLSKEAAFKNYKMIMDSLKDFILKLQNRGQQYYADTLTEILISHLNDKEKRTNVERKYLVETLGEIGSKPAVESLVWALEEAETAKEAYEILKNNAEKAYEALTDLMKTSANKFVRLKILDILRTLSPSISDNFIRDLKDKRWYVRRNTCLILGAISDARAAPAIRELLHDEHPQVRREAYNSLVMLMGSDAEDILLAGLDENDRELTPLLIKHLGKIGTTKSAKILSSMLPRNLFGIGDIDDHIKTEIAIALGQLRDPVAVEGLVDILKDKYLLSPSKVKLQVAAIRALGYIKDHSCIPLLEKLAKSKNTSIQVAAKKAINRIKRVSLEQEEIESDD